MKVIYSRSWFLSIVVAICVLHSSIASDVDSDTTAFTIGNYGDADHIEELRQKNVPFPYVHWDRQDPFLFDFGACPDKKAKSGPINSPRTLLFSMNPGRSGSGYLHNIFGLPANALSFHEQAPDMHAMYLQRTRDQGLPKTFTYRYNVKIRAIDDTLRKMENRANIYADSTHFFLKNLWDIVMCRYGEQDSFTVEVAHMRRYLPEVVASHKRLGFARLWRSWYYHYTNKNMLAIPEFADLRNILGRRPTEIDEILAYLIDMEAHAALFRKRFPNVKVVTARLEELQNAKEVNEFLHSLGADLTPAVKAKVQETVGVAVNVKPSQGHIKPGTGSREEIIMENAISDFLRRCHNAGVRLPPLPHLYKWEEVLYHRQIGDPDPDGREIPERFRVQHPIPSPPPPSPSSSRLPPRGQSVPLVKVPAVRPPTSMSQSDFSKLIVSGTPQIFSPKYYESLVVKSTVPYYHPQRHERPPIEFYHSVDCSPSASGASSRTAASRAGGGLMPLHPDAHHLRVVLGSVPGPDWVHWLEPVLDGIPRVHANSMGPLMTGKPLQSLKFKGYTVSFQERYRPIATGIDKAITHAEEGATQFDISWLLMTSRWDAIMCHLTGREQELNSNNRTVDVELMSVEWYLPYTVLNLLDGHFLSNAWTHFYTFEDLRLLAINEFNALPTILQRKPDDVDIAIAYAVDMIAHRYQFAQRFPKVKVHDVRLEAFYDADAVGRLLSDELGLVVNAENLKIIEEHIKNVPLPSFESDEVAFVERRIREFIYRCRERNVPLPPLLSLTPYGKSEVPSVFNGNGPLPTPSALPTPIAISFWNDYPYQYWSKEHFDHIKLIEESKSPLAPPRDYVQEWSSDGVKFDIAWRCAERVNTGRRVGTHDWDVVFAIHPGRTGIGYLTELITRHPDVLGITEQLSPGVSNAEIVDIRKHGLEQSLARRYGPKVLQFNKPMDSSNVGHKVFVDFSHKFIKANWDTVMCRFGNSPSNFRVHIVHIRRYLPDLIESHLRSGFRVLRDMWYANPSSNSIPEFNDLHTLLDKEPDEIDEIIAFLIDVEAKSVEFKKRFSQYIAVDGPDDKKGDEQWLFLHEVDIEDLETFDSAVKFATSLGVNVTKAAAQRMDSVIERSKSDAIEDFFVPLENTRKMPDGLYAPHRTEEISVSGHEELIIRRRVAEFVKKCLEKKVFLPPLPNMRRKR